MNNEMMILNLFAYLYVSRFTRKIYREEQDLYTKFEYNLVSPYVDIKIFI